MKRYFLFLGLTVLWLRAFAAPEIYTLQFNVDPVPGWSKNRLAGQVLPGNQGFKIFDMTPDAAPFDDAETFKVDSPVTLPYGRKRLTIDIEVDPTIQPLWGNRLMQFQLNGAELDVGETDDGAPSFSKDFGDDGKGFVPAVSGTYQFLVPKDLTDVQFISFMTAGAGHFQFKLTRAVFDVWPEEDLRPRPYLLRYNRLGYLTDQPQPVVLEWQNDLVAEELPLTIRQAGAGERTVELTRTLVFSDVGQPITPLELNLSSENYNTLIIPQTVKRTKHTTALVRTRSELSEYVKQRDLALGAFHWFDMRTYEGAHQQDHQATVFDTNKQRDVYGGWYDAGDYGRYSVNGAWSVYMMLLSYQANADAFPEQVSPLTRIDDSRTAVLDMILPELQFLSKMQRDDGAVFHKVASRDWPLLTTAPADDASQKFVMPISTTATADVAAVMNLAAKIFTQTGRASDQVWAEKFSQVADKAQTFLAAHSERIMIEDRYDGIEYGGPYTDADDTDERLLVVVSELWRGHALSLDVQQKLLELAAQARLSDPVPDWMNVNSLAIFTALFASDDDAFKAQLQALVTAEFSKQIEQQQQNPYGLIYAGNDQQFNWGSNGIIATLGTQLLWLHELTGDDRYWASAYTMSHWFFGLNPHGLIFATGPSRFNAKRPHFRPLVSQAAPKPYGLLVGGPNSVELKGDQVAAAVAKKAPMKVYVDHQESWATNEVAINWQAAWVSYLTLLVNH